jgi:hypothetical protein
VLNEVSDYDAEDEEMDANDAAFRQLRIVSVVGVVLEHTRRNLTDERIAQLQEQILPAIMSSDDLVREAGITCLGKYAMLGLEAAQEYKAVLLAAAANAEERTEIRAQVSGEGAGEASTRRRFDETYKTPVGCTIMRVAGSA